MTRTIGEAIEERLHEMRIQQKELAAVIDVPVSTLNSWLRLGRDIPAHYILKIAHVLRCTPTYLLSGGEEDHGHTGSDPCVHASTYTSSDLSSPRRSATRSSTQPASRYLFAA